MARARARLIRGFLLAGAVGIGAAAAPLVAAGPAAAAPAAGRVATFAGGGFDKCGVPSIADLNAWSSSPYRAFNIYIGGVNAACPQRVSASFVKSATGLGWGIIATYVGLQAPSNQCGCQSIVPSKAAGEGAAAAAQAVKELAAMGIGTGNVVYDDMEGYTTGSTNTPAVLAFLQGWTKKLHALGYVSGVYSGAGSGIADLVTKYGTTYVEPDDIWIADWNYKKTVQDPYVPAADWSNHQRIHQYNGGKSHTYGGVTLNVDGDWCDGAVVAASSL
jgi:hypothetical protein